jgi:hypothetical protein
MYGVAVNANGDLLINPTPARFSPELSLSGLEIRGHHADITADRSRYEIVADSRTMSSGTSVGLRRPV